MKYSSYKKQQKLFESWRSYVKQEAIVDVVAERLPDVFDDEGNMKDEVVNIVKDGIGKLKQWLAGSFPDLEISEVAVVGAAVTYQYGPESDVDVSVVIPGLGENRGAIDDWMEANLVYDNFKGDDNSDRPYEFKPMGDNKGWAHVDAAYDPFSMDWIKKPDIEKAKEMHGKKMGSDSREQKAYKRVEENLQKHFKELYSVLTSTDDPAAILNACKKAYKRKSAMKAMRSRSFDSETEQGYISQNWGFGNVLYKMLDREGYTDVLDILKKVVKNNDLASQRSFLNKLKAALEKVINDELGYQGPKDY
tara:strand:+ start:6272 stop:7189 length:918 start_codon:yes stop_codon:yes gene_type:complete